MNNWSTVKKITAINCGIVIFIGLIIAMMNARDGFGLIFGIICLIGSLLDLVSGILILIVGKKEWSQGFLLSAGILLLLSGISCGTGFMNLNLH